MEILSHPKKRTTIYVTPGVDEDFQKICDREGKSKSEKLEEFMAEYITKHKPGNPQLTMLPYVKPEEAQPMRVYCERLRGAMTDGRVFCQDKGWIGGIACYSCRRNEMRKKK